MKGNLEARQAEMRARMQQQTQKCANKDCTHQARKGQVYCSRCTTKAIQEKLRDTLPGMKPAAPAKQVVEKQESPQQPLDLGVEIDREYPEDPHARYVEKQYSRKQAAKLIGVSQTTLIKWEKKGVCSPRHIAFGNRYIYSEEEIEKARVYRDSYLPINSAPSTAGGGATSPSTLDSFAKQRSAKFALGKKVEKSVAKQLGTIGGRLV